MKYLIITIIFILAINVSAQKEVTTNVFIRIYNSEGEKISKGKIKSISKSLIKLKSQGKIIEVPLSKIGIIKTKRSGGSNIVKGVLIGGGSLAITGILSGDSSNSFITITAADKAAMGLIAGGFVGGIVGGITAIFKRSKLYIIDGDKIKLKAFKENIKRR